MKKESLKKRAVCLIVVEAQTPIVIGSGYKSLDSDTSVAIDVNGLPYIPATALAGVIGENVDSITKSLFGDTGHKDEFVGSQIIFSNGYLIGVEGKPITSVIDCLGDDFYKRYITKLPVRDHVKITKKGVAEDSGKFDNIIVYKGSRFCFEIELIYSDDKDLKLFKSVVNRIKEPTFAVGGGTRKGYGSLQVRQLTYTEYNLENNKDLENYIERTSDLSIQNINDNIQRLDADKLDTDKCELISLHITPEDLYVFGGGDVEKAKLSPKTESVVEWTINNRDESLPPIPRFTDKCIVIPGSSIKGVLAHRTLFYINKATGNYVCTFNEENIQKSQEAFNLLFGYVEGEEKQRGLIMINDVIIPPRDIIGFKYVDHVKIDRFTGGNTGDSALFSEQTVYDNRTIEINIFVRRSSDDNFDLAFKCLKAAITDIKTGALPLGWGTTKGHGRFRDASNKVSKNSSYV